MNYIADSTLEGSPIHVLLVEHDNEDHDRIKNLLHKFSNRVTAVKFASTALSVLSSEFDLMIANMNPPDDVDVFQLLRDAVKMNVVVILMSNDDNALTTMRALEEGAFLCITKPTTMQIMEYLWVHVIRERAYTSKQNTAYGEKDDMESKQSKSGDAKSCKKVNLGVSKHDNAKLENKLWTQWTKELHQKFIDAVVHLGEGRCFPKEILELMNVPGLTRMQVASHLQMCRNSTYIPPGEKKPEQVNVTKTSLKNKIPRAKKLKFGTMPPLSTNCERIQEYHDINLEEGATILDYHNHINGGLVHSNAFAQSNESFNMGPLIMQTLSMDEMFMHDDQNVAPMSNIPSNERDIIEDPFEFANLDTIIQDLCTFEQEIGMNNDGGLQSIATDQVNHN